VKSRKSIYKEANINYCKRTKNIRSMSTVGNKTPFISLLHKLNDLEKKYYYCYAGTLAHPDRLAAINVEPWYLHEYIIKVWLI
jgi:hypothetical protein